MNDKGRRTLRLPEKVPEKSGNGASRGVGHGKAKGKRRPAKPGQFFMVAALGIDESRLSEEEERELKPHHRRHGSHGSALREAHRLARLHGFAFAVLGSGTVARPPEGGGQTDRGEAQEA